MVRVWAEKEMRNLKRLQTAGIRCPEPLEVRENVLVMSLIGDAEGWYANFRRMETINIAHNWLLAGHLQDSKTQAYQRPSFPTYTRN